MGDETPAASFLPQLERSMSKVVRTIDMHTCGEPTRIVYQGFPHAEGTLLEQRAHARDNNDDVRRLLVREPRGHKEMYGAVLVPRTECPAATVGMLFLTNEGYSTMCGHATLAVARLVIDSFRYHFLDDFVNRDNLWEDRAKAEVRLKLHVPCGLVTAVVPIERCWKDHEFQYDRSRPVSYLSVPSFASGINIELPIPEKMRWAGLGTRQSIRVDVAYGGAFYIIVPVSTVDPGASLSNPDWQALREMTTSLKSAFNASEDLRASYLYHPDHTDLQFLYGVIVTDCTLGKPSAACAGAETGVCFFADEQVDRSPTGSGVQARVAVAIAKGTRDLGMKWTYHSPVSNSFGGEGSFTGSAVETARVGERDAVIVQVRGYAEYTGFNTFLLKKDDRIGGGFVATESDELM